MPISKLSAPQPHELVAKVNELVDAANSGGGGPVGEVPGILKIATFNEPCSTLMSYQENSEGNYNVKIGFNVTDNMDGTITLSDFGFTYDSNATFFRDYWILMQDGDYTERLSIATFTDALVVMGIVIPNSLYYGMGVTTIYDDYLGYTYIGFLSCECPPDTEDSSPLQDLMGILSISYLQIGYTIPEITEYEYSSPEMSQMSNRTMSLDKPKEAKKQTLVDKLNAILEAKSNDDI